MMTETNLNRRNLFGAGALAIGASALASSPARAITSASGWQPTMEPSDAWMEKPGTKHRIAFDCTTPDAASRGLDFANNYIHTSMTGYGATTDQLGVIVIMRHQATPFAFNDAMWAKYGAQFIKILSLTGDDATVGLKRNPLFTTPVPAPSQGKGFEWFNDKYVETLVKKGVMFAVCGLATDFFSAHLVGEHGENKAVFNELAANLVPNAHLMPSGIAAVGHAQEHGYAFSYVG